MSKAYFISDLHLGARYIKDEKEKERKVCAFLDSIKSDASELYLVGDILDYWYDYRYVVPRGFVRFFGKLAELSDRGIRITWLIGNHDIWLFDYFKSEMGIEVIDGVLYRNIMGANFIITHGDGVGKRKLSFRTIRSIFRNKFCQLLYASIHPRWTIPFALKWSSSNRKSHESPINTEIEKEINNLTNWANNQLSAKHETNYFVFGHVHYPYKTTLRINIENISKTEMHSAEMAILGDWFSNSSYAAFDGNELFISNWE